MAINMTTWRHSFNEHINEKIQKKEKKRKADERTIGNNTKYDWA